MARRVWSVATGGARLPSLYLERDSNELVAALVGVTRELSPGSERLWRLSEELAATGGQAKVLDGLADPRLDVRLRSISLAGALRMEEAIPGLSRLLAGRQPRLQVAAARALGRIGGQRATDALLRALYWRRGSSMRLVLELARAAPDHYIESALTNPDHAGVRSHLALAAGLRGRPTATVPLIGLLDEGNRGERSAAARALGWIGDSAALPHLVVALMDPTWQIRVAATKALGNLASPVSAGEVADLLLDRNADVRRSASRALRRMARSRMRKSR